MKLGELRKLDEKSEQQANIINSGQIDLWLQEHHQEIDELQNKLNQLRGIVSQQAAILHTVEKGKIDRVIINQEEVLEREKKRLRKNIQDNIEITTKLKQFNQQQYSEIKKCHEDYAELISQLEIDPNELLDLDIENNIDKYWLLISKKSSLERQLSSLSMTVKQ